MAKNDGRSDNEFDGDGKGFPKYLAGVKVPKALRDQGKAAAELARSPLARELLTAGLAAAAAAVVANEKSRKRVKDAGQGAYDAAGEAVAGAGRIGSAILGAFTGLFSGNDDDEDEAPRRSTPKRATGGRKASGTSSRSGTGRRTAAKSSGTGATRRAKSEGEGDGGESAPKRRTAARGASARGTGGRAASSRTGGARKASSRRGGGEGGQGGGEGGNGGQGGGESGQGGEGSGGNE